MDLSTLSLIAVAIGFAIGKRLKGKMSEGSIIRPQIPYDRHRAIFK